jgi:hypothetical protein
MDTLGRARRVTRANARRGTRIDWLDVVDGAWRPFDRIHSEGHR